MSKNNIIDLVCFGKEIGRVGFDEDQKKSFFQYNPAFLKEGVYRHLFPLIFRRIEQVQVFGRYDNDTFRNLPPMLADSLPDMFGNLIFKTWLETTHSDGKISVLEQLAYVGSRGMGALEYRPGKQIPKGTSIDISAVTEVLKQVLENKEGTAAEGLDSKSLINIFKIGTSAGGVRPKILVSENKKTGRIIPGDLEYSADFNHYLVKLSLDDEAGYKREQVEYSYYKAATAAGIRMMPSKLIDGKHFATLRFDRQDGKKQHVLTATGISGMDFRDPAVLAYENLFDLAVFLKVPHRDIDELFRRMVFNIVFCNDDDHLKNHAFIYDETQDKWRLSPAYDITYARNPLLHYNKALRAMSLNGKRTNIQLTDILYMADRYSVKNPKAVITEVQDCIVLWEKEVSQLDVSKAVMRNIRKDFITLL